MSEGAVPFVGAAEARPDGVQVRGSVVHNDHVQDLMRQITVATREAYFSQPVSRNWVKEGVVEQLVPRRILFWNTFRKEELYAARYLPSEYSRDEYGTTFIAILANGDVFLSGVEPMDDRLTQAMTPHEYFACLNPIVELRELKRLLLFLKSLS